MTKQIWVVGTAGAGVILCIFGNSAFAAVGVILGLVAIGLGVSFAVSFFSGRGRSLLVGVGLVVLGIVLVFVCLFSGRAAFFLGGIIMLAAGIILLPIVGRNNRLLFPLCIGCMALGVIILLAPSLIGWLTVAAGIMLIAYSGVLLKLM